MQKKVCKTKQFESAFDLANFITDNQCEVIQIVPWGKYNFEYQLFYYVT